MRAIPSRGALLGVLAVMSLLGLLLSLPCAGAIVSPARTVRVPLEDGVVATLAEDRGLLVEAIPKKGEGMGPFARRLCGDSAFAVQIGEANGGATDLQAGVRYAVPFAILSRDWQLKAVKALFADDRGEADGWRHQVRGVGVMQRESLWRVAEWFTGSGENFRAIREYNELKQFWGVAPYIERLLGEPFQQLIAGDSN